MHKTHLHHSLTGLTFIFCVAMYLCALTQEVVAGSRDQTSVTPAADKAQETARRQQLEQIILNKLAFYAAQFPDIDFVVLDTAGNVARNMQLLAQIIGQDPDPLDYAHPEDLRHALLMTMLMRIEFLLQTDVGSATLFKPGKDAVAKRKYVCVVTLSPWDIARDDRTATRHLLELPQSEIDAVPPAQYLDHASHLRFALDHEVYHCLDTIYNGPIPMSKREYWGKYYMLKNEAGADAFGIIMNIAAHDSITPYARTLGHIRALTLLRNDPNHYTYPAICAVLQLDPAKLAQDDVRERFQVASTLRDRVVGNYDEYVRYMIAAYHAMKQLDVHDGEDKLGQTEVDRKLVKVLIEQTRDSYHRLTGHEMPTAR